MTLTALGTQAVEDVDVRVDAAQAELLAPLSADERDELVRLLSGSSIAARNQNGPPRVTPTRQEDEVFCQCSRSEHKIRTARRSGPSWGRRDTAM